MNLDSLNDWRPLNGSICLRATDDRARRVRIYFNCLEATPLFIVQTDMDDNGLPVKRPARFLATLPAGLEELEFYVAGPVEIAPDHVDRCVYWQATEAETMWFEGDMESFTTIETRAPRNEALEWVQYQSELNQMRMQAALRAEMEEQMAAFKEQYGREAGVHGGPPAEHSKPKGQGGKAGKAGRVPVDGSRVVADPTAGDGSAAADGSDEGEAQE